MKTLVTLECGHVQTQDHPRNALMYGFPPPEVGMESCCWEWGCLRFRPIINVEAMDDAD